MDLYRGVPLPEKIESGQIDAWKAGVDAHYDQTLKLAAAREGAGEYPLKLTGWAKDAVRAFGHATNEDTATARRIIRDMSRQDRAVLAFVLGEVSFIVDDEETLERVKDRRTSHRDVLGDG